MILTATGRNITAADHHWPTVVAAAPSPLRVTFTFDDGPNGEATRALVDILEREHVPAVFFEVGRSIAADPSTTQYVADHGFTVADHTWDHSWNIPSMSSTEIRSELTQTKDLIAQVTGQMPSLMRWPHGRHTALDDNLARAVHLRPVTWNIDPQDYNTQNPQLLTARVVAAVHDKSVILLHDNLQDGQHAAEFHDRRGTIAALPMIIEELRSRGAEFIPLAEMLQLKYSPVKSPATAQP